MEESGGEPKTLLKLLADADGLLRQAGAPTPRLDAEILLCHALGCERAWLFTHMNDVAPEGIAEKYSAMVSRREKREPVAYIRGFKEFYSLTFRVAPEALIPRPETELIIDEAFRLFPAESEINALDIGAGSGAIAVTLAYHRPGWAIDAVDISPGALALACSNALSHEVGRRINFQLSDLYEAIGDKRYNLIVSNPPYIPEESAEVAPDVTKFEPHKALFAGDGGLAIIKRIIKNAPAHLEENGKLILEIGFGQADEVERLVKETGALRILKMTPDYAGITRTVVAEPI